MTPIIECKNLYKSYLGHHGSLEVLKDINLQIQSGEIISIVGPSGCGKTTLIKLLLDIIKPEKGQILYKEKDISYARLSRLIAYIPQSTTLLPNRTIYTNIQFPLEIQNSDIDHKQIERIIQLLGLQKFSNYYPCQLSGGMKKRVAIARAIIQDPKLLIMDEPFSNLDEFTREKLNLIILKTHHKIQQTIIQVTHNIEEAVFVSDRILVMSKLPGQIKYQLKIDLPKNRELDLKTSNKFYSQVVKVRQYLKKT